MILANGVNRDDAGMGQPGHGFRLPLEPEPGLSGGKDRTGQDLHGNAPSQAGLPGFINDAHPASGQFPAQDPFAQLDPIP